MNLISKFHQTLETPNFLLRSVITSALTAGALLLVPFFAKFFIDGMEWTLSDFVAAWILFFGAGLSYKLVARKLRTKTYRAAAAVMVGSVLFLIWANLAVGLIGSEDNDANIMYLGVLAIGVIGSFIVRLKARGMSVVLFSMAAAVGLIALIALIFRLGEPGNPPREIIVVNGFFMFLFSVSALLFRQAGQEPPHAKAEKEQ